MCGRRSKPLGRAARPIFFTNATRSATPADTELPRTTNSAASLTLLAFSTVSRTAKSSPKTRCHFPMLSSLSNSSYASSIHPRYRLIFERKFEYFVSSQAVLWISSNSTGFRTVGLLGLACSQSSSRLISVLSVVGTSTNPAVPLSVAYTCLPSSVVNRNEGQVKLVLMSLRYFSNRVALRKLLFPQMLLRSISQSV